MNRQLKSVFIVMCLAAVGPVQAWWDGYGPTYYPGYGGYGYPGYGPHPYAGPGAYGRGAPAGLGSMRIQTKRLQDGFHITVYLGGRASEDIEVSLEGSRLVVRAGASDRDSDQTQAFGYGSYGQGYRYYSRSHSLSRGFTLPRGLDTSQMTRKDSDGVVEIFIPWETGR